MTGGNVVTRPVRARWDLRLAAAGVLAICLGGLGAALLYANLSQADSVLLVKRTVYRDQVISADDLALASVVPAAGVDTVRSDLLAEVVGRTARLDLTEGSLLSPHSYGEPAVAVGSVRLGLRLAAGRLPSAALPPGSQVLLVPVGRDGAEPPAEPSVFGTVASSPTALPDGASVLDVTVAADEAERVARLAAADQLVLVRRAGGQR